MENFLYKEVNDEARYRNAILNEMRKQTQLLEQIAQLLQLKGDQIHEFHSTEGIPVDDTRQRQQGQRSGNGSRRGRKSKST